MPDTILVRDETTSGKTLKEFTLEIPAETITVRELLRSRVYQEVKDYNARVAGGQQVEFQGLVQPSETELQLNGPSQRGPKPIKWDRQFERALAAFQANQVLILVDEHQVTQLEEEVTLHAASAVSFLRLTLLTGG